MAVKPEQIKARLKAKYPKANLSTKRLDEISAKLAKKPADDADDAAIDEVLEDYNENGPMTFEEIAKSDDKIRTLETKKPVAPENPTPDPDEPAWFTKYKQEQDAKYSKLEQERTQQTIGSKFSNDARVKDIPEFIRVGYVPTSDEDYEEKITALTDAYKPFAEKHKLAGFNGEDIPSGSDDPTPPKGKVKEIDADLAGKIVGVTPKNN